MEDDSVPFSEINLNNCSEKTEKIVIDPDLDEAANRRIYSIVEQNIDICTIPILVAFIVIVLDVNPAKGPFKTVHPDVNVLFVNFSLTPAMNAEKDGFQSIEEDYPPFAPDPIKKVNIRV